MPRNHSPTSRQPRQAKALARFSLDPKRADDKLYQERKAEEKAALERVVRR